MQTWVFKLMIRQHENSDAFKAGALSVTVHVLLLGAMLFSFNWKTTHPVSIAEVELWDSLPTEAAKKTLPTPVPLEQPKPVVKQTPKVEPKPVPKPDPELKVDIAIKKKPIEKPVEKAKPKDEKKPDALAELQKQMMQDALQKHEKVADNDALKQLQQEIAKDDNATSNQKSSVAQAAVNAGVIGEFTNKIKAKIRGNVNKSLCGDGNPELKFEIALLPTGQLSSYPKLVKSSGSVACDDAVERAIMASEPLPLPSDTSLFSQFRNLKLTFRPNGN